MAADVWTPLYGRTPSPPDFSPFLETDVAEQQLLAASSDARLKTNDQPSARPAFTYALECLSEAQADLCSHLHLALVENASIRNEIGTLQDTECESQRQQERVEAAAKAAVAQAEAADATIAQLRVALSAREAELARVSARAEATDARFASAAREFRESLAAVHASAKRTVAEHEERLVRESNRSIETARVVAEKRATQALETAMHALQQQHAEYLQRLAEEHAEEVESLTQQVVVWRHQVEVLTEAEKRNYAAMMSSGVNPYHDFQRSRFGAPRASERAAGRTGTAAATDSSASGHSHGRGSSVRQLGTSNAPSPQQQQALEYESWRDGTPEDPSDHTFSELSDRSSLVLSHSSNSTKRNNATLWDRVVALIAD